MSALSNKLGRYGYTMCPPVLVKQCITTNLCKNEIKNRKCAKKTHATDSLQF